jgi:two-component system, LytTR family, response regulator
VDDEPDAHQLLLYYCHQHGGIHIKGHFYDAMATLDFLQGNKVELIFLDINMPEISGLQLASMIGTSVQIIFTTAHSQHALEG